MSTRKMLGLIDAIGRAEFNTSAFKTRVWTEEQQAMLDYYEPAARIYCRNNGKNPDQMCDCLAEGSSLSGLPEIYRQPAWQLVVDVIHEVYRAIAEATVNYQQATAAAKAMGLNEETTIN
jgi:hypothetical protein